jgi:hypothetical protein
MFQPDDVQLAALRVYLFELQPAGLRHAQAVPEHQKQQATVARLVAASPGRRHQLSDFKAGQVATSGLAPRRVSFPGRFSGAGRLIASRVWREHVEGRRRCCASVAGAPISGGCAILPLRSCSRAVLVVGASSSFCREFHAGKVRKTLINRHSQNATLDK